MYAIEPLMAIPSGELKGSPVASMTGQPDTEVPSMVQARIELVRSLVTNAVEGAAGGPDAGAYWHLVTLSRGPPLTVTRQSATAFRYSPISTLTSAEPLGSVPVTELIGSRSAAPTAPQSVVEMSSTGA